MDVTIRTTRRHVKVIREGRRVDGGDDSGPTDHALNSLKNVATRQEGEGNEHSHQGNRTARRGCL